MTDAAEYSVATSGSRVRVELNEAKGSFGETRRIMLSYGIPFNLTS